MVIGKEKFWSLSYANDIVLLAKHPQDLKEMINRMKRYFERRELMLNARKSKIIIFKKGRCQKKKGIWKWGEEELEEVKDFKYLGYRFQKNGGTEMHWRETAKKAMIVMKQTWGIGERRFKNNFERRMKIYRSMVKSVMMYAAEIWGWSESERLEKLHTKYIKWVLGMDFNTPTYIVMDETKEDKIRIEAGRRAVKYEEKTRTNGINKIILECWKEVDTKCERKRSKWKEQRRQYYEEKGS